MGTGLLFEWNSCRKVERFQSREDKGDNGTWGKEVIQTKLVLKECHMLPWLFIFQQN